MVKQDRRFLVTQTCNCASQTLQEGPKTEDTQAHGLLPASVYSASCKTPSWCAPKCQTILSDLSTQRTHSHLCAVREKARHLSHRPRRETNPRSLLLKEAASVSIFVVVVNTIPHVSPRQAIWGPTSGTALVRQILYRWSKCSAWGSHLNTAFPY